MQDNGNRRRERTTAADLCECGPSEYPTSRRATQKEEPDKPGFEPTRQPSGVNVLPEGLD